MNDETPITVKKIKMDPERRNAYLERGMFPRTKVGAPCSIRPCADEYENKTYLGFYIGAIALSMSSAYSKETQELEVGFSMHNPAIFVPEINKVIFGMESWWGEITSEDQLKQITDEDINNVWYVQAMKAMADAMAEEEAKPNGQ